MSTTAIKIFLEQVNSLLSPEVSKKANRLFVVLFASSLLEVAGLASVMPLMVFLGDPEILYRLVASSELTNYLRRIPGQGLIILSVLLVITLFSLSLAARAFTAFSLFRFAHHFESQVSADLIHRYLSQPYQSVIRRSKVEYGTSMLSEVSQVANSVILPLMNITAQSLTICFVIILLLVVDPISTILALCGFSLFYYTVFVLLKNYMRASGGRRVVVNAQKFNIVDSAFSGIKDVKVSDSEQIYIEAYKKAALEYAKLQSMSQTVSFIPKYFLEGLAFGGILLYILITILQGGSIEAVLPKMSIFAMAAYRILPGMSQIYGGFSHIVYAKPALNKVVRELNDSCQTKSLLETNRQLNTEMSKILSIKLERLQFDYKGLDDAAALETSNRGQYHYDLTLHSGQSVAIVGPSGSGKSTLVDLLVGLLTPTRGGLYVNDKKLTAATVIDFRRSVGYVGQNVFLQNDSVRSNIVFNSSTTSLSESNITEKVQKVLHTVGLWAHVEKNLARGIETTIGDAGRILSGGQRQRLGIARALFRSPEVLILDEATSALDPVSESEILSSLHDNFKNHIFITVTHRIATTQRFDRIIVLNDGLVVGDGSYADLASSNEFFRELLLEGDLN